MLSRILSVLIGYVFGCFLTAEIVARKFAGMPASAVGETGNPGMANIMASLGFIPGILTLLGDILKCLLPMLISYLLFYKTGWIITMYAGLGCTLGHDFPFWRGFKGGKGVATSSAVLVIYDFVWALIAHIAGPVIPLFFTVFMFIKGDTEAAILSIVFSALALLCHLPSVFGIFKGTTSQTDVLGALMKKFRKK